MKKITSFLLVICLIFQGISGQDKGLSSIMKSGIKPEKLSGDFQFTEGPAADSKGDVYFTDQPNDRIMVWTTKNELKTFMQPSGRSNGLFFDRNGFLWSCADEKNELWKIDMQKNVEVVLGEYNGAPFNGPNDLWIAPDGSIFFTDPFYRRSWWDHQTMPQEKQCVYYLSADRQTLKRVADDLVQPNGIIGTPDGKILYVADIGAKKTWKYVISSDGTLENKTLFCEMGSDGMTIDSKGNVYLTGRGVTVFDRNGTRLGNIDIPENWTANVCFGGRNRKTLFITASKSLYRINLNVRGVY